MAPTQRPVLKPSGLAPSAVDVVSVANRPPSTPAKLGRPAVTDRLLYRLEATDIAPDLERWPHTRCLNRAKELAAANPLSGEHWLKNTHHRRIPLTAGPRLRDIRDALTLRAPRTVRWKGVRAPHSAKLRLSYALGMCSGWRTDRVRLVATATRGDNTLWTTQVALERPTPLKRGTSEPWTDIELPIDLPEGTEFELTVSLQAVSPSDPVVSLAQIQIVGRPRLQSPKEDRNVILLIVDALRSDLVGPARRMDLPQMMPNLDAFIARGTSFKRAFAVSNQTRHSTLAILTSQTPTMGGFFSLAWQTKGPLRDRWYASKPPLLPIDMAAAGWHVSTIGHNRFLFPHHPWGMDHGFDRIWNNAQRDKRDTPQLVDRAIQQLTTAADDRFFLYLNLVTPHLPYSPPKAHLAATIDKLGGQKHRLPGNLAVRYLAELAFLDAELARFIHWFDGSGLAANTTVIVTADHGEVFGLHHACRSQKMNAKCRLNHGLTLYDEELHVPLAFVGPGLQAGRVIATNVSQIDLAPTILELTGQPENLAHSGTSLMPLLGGNDTGVATKERPIYSESKRMVSLVVGQEKLIVHSTWSDIRTPSRMNMTPAALKALRKASQLGGPPTRLSKRTVGRYELYDLKADPAERLNLAAGGASNERVKGLLNVLEGHRKTLAERLSRRPYPAVAKVPQASEPPPDKPTRAFNVLLVRGGGDSHRLTGTLSVSAGDAIVCGYTHGKATCAEDGPAGPPGGATGRRIQISFEAGAVPAGAAFETRPWNAPIEFTLALDGREIAPTDLRLGPFGVTLEPNSSVESLLERSQARHPPRLSKTGDLGVFFWRNLNPDVPLPRPSPLGDNTANAQSPAAAVPLGPEAIEGASEETMDEGMRQALKELGYTQ